MTTTAIDRAAVFAASLAPAASGAASEAQGASTVPAKAAYAPPRGTIPYRAIEHLKTLPPGHKINTAALTEACGCDLAGFHTVMRPAVTAGLVRKEPSSSAYHAPSFWSLGDGVLIPETRDADDEEADDPPLVQVVAPAPGTADALMSAWRTPAPVAPPEPHDPDGDEPEIEIPATALPRMVTVDLDGGEGYVQVDKRRNVLSFPAQDHVEPATFDDEPAEFTCALWSNGVLQLQRGDEFLELSRAETEHLVAYLERMVEAPAELSELDRLKLLAKRRKAWNDVHPNATADEQLEAWGRLAEELGL